MFSTYSFSRNIVAAFGSFVVAATCLLAATAPAMTNLVA